MSARKTFDGSSLDLGYWRTLRVYCSGLHSRYVYPSIHANSTQFTSPVSDTNDCTAALCLRFRKATLATRL